MNFRNCSTWCGLLLAVSLGAVAEGQKAAPACSQCAVWNAPQKPFHVYGNTYYVGPHGLGSLLIKTDAGLVLIDGALPQSAGSIAENVRALGFRMKDVKLILSTHAHYDHAGGIAELQRLSGAEVMASPWTAQVFRTGKVSPDDPQYGELPGIAPVARVRVLREGEAVRLGSTVLTAHSTPGHTPGGTSWTWESCEAGHCLGMVYADSVSAVSAGGYKYSAHPDVLRGFERSFAFLDGAHCDVLLTPHPEASDLWDRMAARERGVTHDPLVDVGACKKLAATGRENLQKRIASETGS